VEAPAKEARSSLDAGSHDAGSKEEDEGHPVPAVVTQGSFDCGTYVSVGEPDWFLQRWEGGSSWLWSHALASWIFVSVKPLASSRASWLRTFPR